MKWQPSFVLIFFVFSGILPFILLLLLLGLECVVCVVWNANAPCFIFTSLNKYLCCTYSFLSIPLRMLIRQMDCGLFSWNLVVGFVFGWYHPPLEQFTLCVGTHTSALDSSIKAESCSFATFETQICVFGDCFLSFSPYILATHFLAKRMSM